MRLEREDFDRAVQRGIITPEQAEALWNDFCERDATGESDRTGFTFANVAYYFGALIVISAMGWLMNSAWESFGGSGLFFIALGYAIAFILAGRYLYFQENMRVPGGLLFTMAVTMTPLAIYGLQRWTGFWQASDPGIYQGFHTWIKGSWFLMELGTILAGLLTLKFVRFPFLTAPIAFCLWYMSMDITPLLFGEGKEALENRAWVSFWFGIGCLIVAYLIDIRHRRSRGDFAFWLYLFGLLSFSFSLVWLVWIVWEENPWLRFMYCLTNLGLLLLSILLKRRLFVLFGGIGIFHYLTYLSYQVFADSIWFPFALTFLGICIIGIGIFYQRHYQHLTQFFESYIPDELRNLLPKER
jgi:Predicted membrane protein (DUF2157)